MESIYREGTRFDDSREPVVQLNFRTGSEHLKSLEQVRAERAAQQFADATNKAYRMAQVIELAKGESADHIKFPQDSVELVRVIGPRQVDMRETTVRESLNGEFENNRWFEMEAA